MTETGTANRVEELLNEREETENQILEAEYLRNIREKEIELRQAELQNNLNEQKDIQKYRNDYEHLRNQLELVETDLKNAYERYNTSLDPEFLKKREIEFINNKLNKLKTERDTVMKKLKMEYNIRTKCNNVSYKLNQTNNEFINTQNSSIKYNKNNIDKLSQEIHFKDRLVSMKKYKVNNLNRRLNILITILGVITVSMFPTILAFMNLISGRLAFISLIVFSIVGGIIIRYKFNKVPNRSKRVWELRNYGEPTDKKTAEEVVVQTTTEVVEQQGETIEDILSAKLRDYEKCS